ncbi:MAG: ParB N-terminal domain-containing protein [Clostridia bacterium]|nr:ParB N-terminal domain-containing protein [Clostridia bacterium]
MIEKKLYTLRIDEAFRSLIRPLHRTEFEALEKSLRAEGCRDPIVVWDGTIIDGHNRYDICSRHKIPFPILEITFD